MKNPQINFLISWKIHFCTANISVWILESFWRHCHFLWSAQLLSILENTFWLMRKPTFVNSWKNQNFPDWRRNGDEGIAWDRNRKLRKISFIKKKQIDQGLEAVASYPDTIICKTQPFTTETTTISATLFLFWKSKVPHITGKIVVTVQCRA